MPYCNACGAKYDDSEAARCVACGKDLPHAPAKSSGIIADDDTLNPPHMRRFAAGVIDMAAGYAVGAWLVFILARRFPILRGVWFVAAFVILMFPNPYLLLKDAIEGKSIGKLVMGLVAYNEKERRPTGLLDSIIRNWYLVVPVVGPLVLAATIGIQILAGRRRRLGEDAANTLVISDLDYQRIR